MDRVKKIKEIFVEMNFYFWQEKKEKDQRRKKIKKLIYTNRQPDKKKTGIKNQSFWIILKSIKYENDKNLR